MTPIWSRLPGRVWPSACVAVLRSGAGVITGAEVSGAKRASLENDNTV